MARQSALPTTLPPRLICRDAAAEYVDVSPNTFDKMIESGTMPPPRRLTMGRVAWDVRHLDRAVDLLPIEGQAEQVDTDKAAEERFDAARKAAKAKKVAPE